MLLTLLANTLLLAFKHLPLPSPRLFLSNWLYCTKYITNWIYPVGSM